MRREGTEMRNSSSLRSLRRWPAWLAAALVLAAASAGGDQIPGSNVNMVAGTTWPDGDPFLQRQNESSMAVSTRNPLHLLAGANDYRTVDVPGLPDSLETGDAWLSYFRSTDGGGTWKSTLIPGYPQDNSPAGLASPLKGYQAGADPTVRAGTNGTLYYSGIVFDRAVQQGQGGGARGAVFVARFIDNNNKENGDPVALGGITIVDRGNSGQFVDKPWLAVALPGPGATTCTFAGNQPFLGGNVYLSYAVFVGNDNNIRTKVMFARSTDCGATFSQPIKLSEGYPIGQGTTMTIDSISGAVYVFWRQFKNDQVPDAMIMAKSVDGGQTFTKGTQVALINPFQQGTTPITFRHNAFPTAAVDAAGRVYLAWSQKGPGPGGDARIVLTVSTNGGTTWSAPTPVDNTPPCLDPNAACRGHQLMPSMTIDHGRVVILYYDLRQDHTVSILNPSAQPGQYDQTWEAAGDLASPAQPAKVYTDFIMEAAPQGYDPMKRRHTMDVRVLEGIPGAVPLFGPSVMVSRYSHGSLPGETQIRQLKYNPPLFRLFQTGGVPFHGDYMDIASLFAKPVPGTTQWLPNINFETAPVRHGTWTDNRDVRPPLDGNWANYVPVGSVGGQSLFDPTQTVPACTPVVEGQTGMRNQNVYTSRITQGLVVGSPGNAKPLGQTTFPDHTIGIYQRAFVVFVQNTSDEGNPTCSPDPKAPARCYRLSIANQPVGGKATFLQFAQPNFPDPLTQLDLRVPARSSATRTVFVTSTNPDAPVTVNVTEIDAPSGTEVPPDQGGLQGAVVLNPDVTNPDVTNPDVTNPDVTNPDVTNAEVYNPDVTNPDVTNPDVTNPDVTNPDVTNPDVTNADVVNPDVTNPDVTNPDVTNPDVTNPDVTNPDVTNPDVTNGAISDTTWTSENEGNTAAGYSVKLFTNQPVPPGFKTQLLIHEFYQTPVAVGCELKQESQDIVIANVPNPVFFTDPAQLAEPTATDPSVTNATFHRAPGGRAKITLRVVDPNRFDAITFDAASAVLPAVQAQAVNTVDALNGVTQAPVVLPGLTSLEPGTAAAGFGQLVGLSLAGSFPLGDLFECEINCPRVVFTQGGVSRDGFLFRDPSSSTLLFARLPFVGDNNGTSSNLSPGPALVKVVSGGVSSNSLPLVVSPTPGKPRIRVGMGLASPPDPDNPCGILESTEPITLVAPGQGIAISAIGTDTTQSVALFTQGGSTVEVSSSCTYSSSGIANVFTVPAGLANGPVLLSIRTSVNDLASPASDPVTLTVFNGILDFETFLDGSPACGSCPLTDEYADAGVVFSFSSEFTELTNAQLFNSASYDPPAEAGNHSVTSAQAPPPGGGFYSGVVTMTFAGNPTQVIFRLRGNDDISVYPVTAYDSDGGLISSEQITRTDVSTYTSPAEFIFRQETVTVTNAGGISRIDLNMDGFIVLIDNLKLP